MEAKAESKDWRIRTDHAEVFASSQPRIAFLHLAIQVPNCGIIVEMIEHVGPMPQIDMANEREIAEPELARGVGEQRLESVGVGNGPREFDKISRGHHGGHATQPIFGAVTEGISAE